MNKILFICLLMSASFAVSMEEAGKENKSEQSVIEVPKCYANSFAGWDQQQESGYAKALQASINGGKASPKQRKDIKKARRKAFEDDNNW